MKLPPLPYAEIHTGAYNRFTELLPYYGEDQMQAYAFAVVEAVKAECVRICTDEAWRLKRIAIDNESGPTNMKSIGVACCADLIKSLEIEP